jgi:hypothetical protein
MSTTPMRLSPSGPVITNEQGAPLSFGPGARVRLTETVSTMEGSTAIPECPQVISAEGFGSSNAITLVLDTPNSQLRYRANMSLDLASRSTLGGGLVVLYLDTSVDAGANFTNQVKNSHQINTGINASESLTPPEARQAQIWMPLISGNSLGVSANANSPSPSLQLRARAQLISGASGIVEVFSHSSEAGDGFGDCSEAVTGMNGTIHLELEECF